MPMVWYIPPLSPVVDVVQETGEDAEDKGNLFAAIDALRIPVEYLAELFTAGDVGAGGRGAQEARRDALLHARHQHGPRPGRLDPGRGRDDRGGDVRHVPPARDREVRRALRHPARARRAGALPGGAGHRVLGLGVRRRAAGPLRRGLRRADADRGRELPDAAGPADLRLAGRARRTRAAGSTCSTGTARARRPGCSRRRDRTRERPSREAGAAARAADHRVAVGLAAARTTPTSSCSPQLDADQVGLAAPAAGDRRLDPRVPGAPRGDAAAGAAGRLRRDVRQPPALQPLPHLLRPRRHPQAGDGAAALQADLPARRVRARRRRAARPPVRRARVRRHRRPASSAGS